MEMNVNAPQPTTIMQTAQKKALKIGFLCSVSFLCSVRGITSPGISTVGHLVGLLAVYNIFKSIIKYRLYVKDIKFGKCFLLALLICIFASLLTNVIQYLYFQFYDNGVFLSTLASMMETPEYQQMIKALFGNVPQSELKAAFQQLNVPTLMTQIIFMNLVLSVPVSLITAAFAAYPTISRTSINQSEQNIEKNK